MVRNVLTILAALAFSAASPAFAEDPKKTDGSDIGITIMGAIVQKASEDNVALIKEQSGTVRAVKRDHVIMDKYKVLAVHPEYIHLVTRDAKHIYVYQDKFAGNFTVKKSDAPSSTAIAGVSEQYKEEGFERVKGKVTMTGMYRDKLIKEDLARVLMQATAEPYMEGSAIVGFKLSQIDDGSIYAKAGLTNGDIITSINGSELSSVAGSIKLLQSLKGADHLEVDVRRDAATMKITVDVN